MTGGQNSLHGLKVNAMLLLMGYFYSYSFEISEIKLRFNMFFDRKTNLRLSYSTWLDLL